MKKSLLFVFLTVLPLWATAAGKVTLVLPAGASPRLVFGAEKLESALKVEGYVVRTDSAMTRWPRTSRSTRILIGTAGDALMTEASMRMALKFGRMHRNEGFSIRRKGRVILLRGDDASGALYACLELADRIRETGGLPDSVDADDSPDMVLRGSCIGVQKPYYLPGRTVYEYPYTPGNFPWFYDKALWIKYLDMLVENRMNSLYLWNGHPFASLVRLKDYPFAVEVSDEDFQKNRDMFAFLTREADKRGIWVIQMFYNILVSKPFAEHYGIKTQDRNRPITPLISDYTRQSIEAFISQYPNVGLLVCLGEAMATEEDDVEWFTKTILPGVRDGLKILGKTGEVPIILRAHDTNCEKVMKAALPLYKNLFTMNKYNGESLTTYQPGGSWAQTHLALSKLGSTHVDNVHILSNLEPFRWFSPDFVQKTVGAMHAVHGANALHLYPQASYWDWPYTADKTEPRLLEMDRDRRWYEAWGRYAWKQDRDRKQEIEWWSRSQDSTFGCSGQGGRILEACEQMAEISPKLTRKLAITEGNRQTFLLGSFMSQLVNPTRWRVYPGFHESCGPVGELLDEWVRKEYAGEPHTGENPMGLADEALMHGISAVKALESVSGVSRQTDEFARLLNDARCYRAFARCIHAKVHAASLVLRYTHSNDLADLDQARPFLAASLEDYRELERLTRDTYLYANSMQTRQRKIPTGGDDGRNKTWAELLPLFEDELVHFDHNLEQLHHPAQAASLVKPLLPVEVTTDQPLYTLDERPRPYPDKDLTVVRYADELKLLKGFRLPYDQMRNQPTQLRFTCTRPVSVLVGYFGTVQTEYLAPSRLETDASADDFGQAEVRISNALEIPGQPRVNVHTFTFPAGSHTLSLGQGAALVLGFADGTTPLRNRDAGLGEKTNIDWIFQ